MVCYTDTSITLLPCCLRARSLSAATHPRMASLIFSSASSRVSPSEWQPGSAGQLTINPPSSGSGVTTTLNIIIGRLLLSPYRLIIVWKHLTRRECPGREWRTPGPPPRRRHGLSGISRWDFITFRFRKIAGPAGFIVFPGIVCPPCDPEDQGHTDRDAEPCGAVEEGAVLGDA